MRNLRLASMFLVAGALLAPAAAQAAVDVTVVHGVPGVTVDVYANGARLLAGFKYGEISPVVSVPAGTYDLAVFVAGADPKVAAPAIALPGAKLPDGANVSVVAHLTDKGALKLTPFVNDVKKIGFDARLAVRHTAQAPAVNVIELFYWIKFVLGTIANGAQIEDDTWPGSHKIGLAPAGSRKIIAGPYKLSLRSGSYTAVYAVGSLNDGSFRVLVQTVKEGRPSRYDDCDED